MHLRFTIDHSLSLASLVCMFQHSTFSIEVDCLNVCSSECLHLPFAIFNSWDFPCLHVLVPGLRVLCMYTRQHRTTRPWEPESRNQVLGRLHVCLPLPGPIAPDRRMRARRNPGATEPLGAHTIRPSCAWMHLVGLFEFVFEILNCLVCPWNVFALALCNV